MTTSRTSRGSKSPAHRAILLKATALAMTACLLLAACDSDAESGSDLAGSDLAGSGLASDQVAANGPADDAAAVGSATPAAAGPADATGAAVVPGPSGDAIAELPTPRDGAPLPGAGTPGVDIVLGEWALVASVSDAPPGTTTFRFRNLGTVPHALRIRTPGSGGDRLEWRSPTIAPGESGLLVADLAAGTYEVDCPIEDGHGEHDELGMEMLFTVRDGAAVLAALPDAAGEPTTAEAQGADGAGPPPSDLVVSAPRVDIQAFAFEPAELRVPVGTEVVWTNRDPAPHTVTHDRFDTGPLDQGATGTVTFDTSGTFDYICAIHPTMRGRVIVQP